MGVEDLTADQYFLSLPHELYKNLVDYTEEEYEFFRLLRELLCRYPDLPPPPGCVRAISTITGIEIPKWALLELNRIWPTVAWEKRLSSKGES